MKGKFGYLTFEPCRVCWKVNNNQMEPHYGYVVCEEHQKVPPYKIPPLDRNRKVHFSP